MPAARGGGRACHAAADAGAARRVLLDCKAALTALQQFITTRYVRPDPAGRCRRAPGRHRRPSSRLRLARSLDRHRQAIPSPADGEPPGDDPGLVKVSIPEVRRLARLATAPITAAAHDPSYAWSDGAAAARQAPAGTTIATPAERSCSGHLIPADNSVEFGRHHSFPYF